MGRAVYKHLNTEFYSYKISDFDSDNDDKSYKYLYCKMSKFYLKLLL